MAQVFTREQFYDLDRSKPMRHLAREFGISDVALHKICPNGVRDEFHLAATAQNLRKLAKLIRMQTPAPA